MSVRAPWQHCKAQQRCWAWRAVQVARRFVFCNAVTICMSSCPFGSSVHSEGVSCPALTSFLWGTQPVSWYFGQPHTCPGCPAGCVTRASCPTPSITASLFNSEYRQQSLSQTALTAFWPDLLSFHGVQGCAPADCASVADTDCAPSLAQPLPHATSSLCLCFFSQTPRHQ